MALFLIYRAKAVYEHWTARGPWEDIGWIWQKVYWTAPFTRSNYPIFRLKSKKSPKYYWGLVHQNCVVFCVGIQLWWPDILTLSGLEWMLYQILKSPQTINPAGSLFTCNLPSAWQNIWEQHNKPLRLRVESRWSRSSAACVVCFSDVIVWMKRNLQPVVALQGVSSLGSKGKLSHSSIENFFFHFSFCVFFTSVTKLENFHQLDTGCIRSKSVTKQFGEFEGRRHRNMLRKKQQIVDWGFEWRTFVSSCRRHSETVSNSFYK